MGVCLEHIAGNDCIFCERTERNKMLAENNYRRAYFAWLEACRDYPGMNHKLTKPEYNGHPFAGQAIRREVNQEFFR